MLTGSIFDTTHKEYFTDSIFRRTVQKELAQKGGVAPDDLRFNIYSDFFFDMYEKQPNYDCNAYLDDYQKIMDEAKALGVSPDKNRQMATIETFEENY